MTTWEDASEEPGAVPGAGDRPQGSLRPYRATDRAAVRRICHRTGYMGEPAWHWRDEESFADVFCGWYTDHEPGSAWVCEVDGGVAGYLLGCEDTARATDPARLFLGAVARRSLYLRPGTAGFVWRSVGDALVAGARRRLPPSAFLDPRWPAHLHIDLLPEARGSGLGAALVRTWLDALRSRGVPGCHLETLAENTGAVAFFEAMGFVRQAGPYLVPGLRTRRGGRIHLVVMVRDV